ncbi:MAG: inositol monophosphatase [Candidatus Thorarchaeota archaeon]|nr:MAG: inositol monophosphatase [Candidatus Thorarchaeota archaeon]
MSLMSIIEDAIGAARNRVLGNLEHVSERTGELNPFGDNTLVLDESSEEDIINVFRDSKKDFAILSEEHGLVTTDKDPDYIAIVDPIDGSTNLERGMPLCTVGISVAPFSRDATTEDIEISVIDSYFTEETYVAIRGEGVTRNGRPVRPSDAIDPAKSIVSYDTKKEWSGEFKVGSLKTLVGVYDMRRTGSNLLDLCWTACGALDGMIDLRDILPIVHASGTHMVLEAGGCVLDIRGEDFVLPLDITQRMSFVAAGSRLLAGALVGLFNDR